MGFQIWIRRFTENAYRTDSKLQRWRAERMRRMLELVHPPTGARVVDLGGTPYVWSLIEHSFHVTLVNLPGGTKPADDEHYRFVQADACDLKAHFPDYSFDLAFSNSVIEHVGDEPRQALFAAEVQRLAKAYWVQTPSTRFPIEAHTGIPFYWRYPQWVRGALLRRWDRSLPAWCAMIRETRVLSRRRMEELFPGAEFFTERRFGFEKSYAAYRQFHGGANYCASNGEALNVPLAAQEPATWHTV